MKTNNGKFVKDNPPPKHKDNCSCFRCGGKVWNKGKSWSDEMKIKLSKSHKGQKAWNAGKKNIYSEETLEKMSLAKRGRTPANWKGGTKTERRLAMERYEYKQWRKEVFERDNYTCQECSKKGGNLQADHIKRWSKFPKLRYSVENGRTLCVSCHYKITFGKNMPENIKNWGSGTQIINLGYV